MFFGILSAIALGIGITGTAQDFINGDAAVQQDESGIQVEETRQIAETDDRELTR